MVHHEVIIFSLGTSFANCCMQIINNPARMKKCFVPTCKNDTENNPKKLFVRIREDLKEKWCKEVNTKYFRVYAMYCCEDHFDPEQDLKNYLKFKLMNDEPVFKPTAVLRNISLKPQAIPRVLQGESSELRKLLLHEPPVTKRIKLYVGLPSTSGASLPFKVNKSTNFKAQKSVVNKRPEEPSSHEISSSAAAQDTLSLYEPSETDKKIMDHSTEENKNRNKMLEIINKNPKLYLGLPKQYLWLINYLVENSESKIDSLYIIVALFKIRQNDSIERMSHQFDLSRTKLSTMILVGVEVLGNFFQHLVICPDPKLIKQKLPSVFKITYSNVQMIIDCFEIKISKPSNSLKQAQTWTQCKNCNTVKYLIGCTPNGLVSFISKGYGGRISDKAIVEKSRFVDVLPHNTVILADRGFKEIESLLSSRGIKLIRAPTVDSNVKQILVKTQKSKVISSLRVPVERVIRHIREFSLLKPLSVVHYTYVPYLDEAVIIACGLINLQGEITKSF